MKKALLVFLCVLAWAPHGFSQTSLIHHNTSAGAGVANGATLALTSTTAGDTIVVGISCDSTPGTTATVTDTQGNTYTQRSAITWSGKRLYALEAHGIVGGADTITVTTGCGGTQDVLADEFSVANAFDQQATNTATNTALTSTATSATTSTNELIYGLFVATSGTITADTGAGFASTGTGASANRVLNAEWMRVTSTGAQTATATESVSQAYAALVVTMAEPGGGGATCSAGLLTHGVGSC